jgi:hypothetical protein
LSSNRTATEWFLVGAVLATLVIGGIFLGMGLARAAPADVTIPWPCSTVRMYFNFYGEAATEAKARSARLTSAQKAKAKRCITHPKENP